MNERTMESLELLARVLMAGAIAVLILGILGAILIARLAENDNAPRA